jgi:hypothetical protein
MSSGNRETASFYSRAPEHARYISHMTQALATDLFNHDHYVIKRPFWSFLGRRFHVYGSDGRLVLYVKHPLFRWREEFTVFTDESETVPVLTIRARQIVALDLAHDVFDARTGQRVGTLKRRGWKSIIRDHWDILDEANQPVGAVEEKGNALLRRFIPILTSRHSIVLGAVEVARVQQIFRFFVKEFVLDLRMGRGLIDPRFAVACALLAVMAEAQREARS